MSIKIEGLIVPTRPMHIATSLKPDLRFDYKTGRTTNGKDGMPMTGTVQKGIIVDGKEWPEYIPYFPANDIRGRLRRHAAEHVFEHLLAREEPVSIDVYDGMNAGNFRGRPDNTPTTLEEMRAFREHFFMGLFGGGPRTLPSKLVTHDIDPIYDGTLSIKSVPDRYSSYAFSGAPRDMCDVFGCIRRDDTASFSNLKMVDYIKDGFEAINERQDELSIARAKRKREKSDNQKDQEASGAHPVAKLKKDDLANMFAYQVIRAGLPMYFEMGFSSMPTDAQAGLLLEGLVRIFNENALGGLIRIGAGSFSGFANLVVDGRVLGEVLHKEESRDENVNTSFVLTELADKYIDAKDAALSESSAEDLRRFFVYGEPVVNQVPDAPEAA